MKLKTLLLGSAAAMIAVSGARAADAVIAEPEAVEYVRVCDLYGPGFFYIPGTETCLKFDGYVRLDYSASTDNVVRFGARAVDPTSAADIALDAADGITDNIIGDPILGVVAQRSGSSNFEYRARLNVDARNETDYGTLRSQIRFQGDSADQGDASVGIDRALISLGGLRFGYSDTFTTTFHGYGNPVEKYDGYYGYDQALFIDYTYKAGGFEIAAGMQDSGEANGVAANPYSEWAYYVGAKYSADLGYIAASYIYEENVDEGAWKVSAAVTPFEGRLLLKAWYVADEDGQTAQVAGSGDWAWGVGANYKVLDNFAVRVAYTDADFDYVDVLTNPAGTAVSTNLNRTDAGFFTVGAQWNPVPGLSVRPEARIWSDDDRGQDYSLRVYRTF